MKSHQAIFKSMQQENQAESVYTKKWMKVSTNTSITVSCKADLGKLDQRAPRGLPSRHRLFT